MATINISNLNPKGYDLFLDSEDYLSELSLEVVSLSGGNSLTNSLGEDCFFFTPHNLPFILPRW